MQGRSGHVATLESAGGVVEHVEVLVRDVATDPGEGGQCRHVAGDDRVVHPSEIKPIAEETRRRIVLKGQPGSVRTCGVVHNRAIASQMYTHSQSDMDVLAAASHDPVISHDNATEIHERVRPAWEPLGAFKVGASPSAAVPCLHSVNQQ